MVNWDLQTVLILLKYVVMNLHFIVKQLRIGVIIFYILKAYNAEEIEPPTDVSRVQ